MSDVKYIFILIMTVAVLKTVPVFSHSGEKHSPQSKMTVDKETDEVFLKKEIEDINRKYIKNVRPIFLEKCMTCHGQNSNLPWYYPIPGVKQLINSDIKTAKEHLDMSDDFPFKGHGTKTEDLDAIKESIEKGSMPPLRYRIMHWGSSVSEMEKETINKWIDESIKILNSKKRDKTKE